MVERIEPAGWALLQVYSIPFTCTWEVIVREVVFESLVRRLCLSVNCTRPRRVTFLSRFLDSASFRAVWITEVAIMADIEKSGLDTYEQHTVDKTVSNNSDDEILAEWSEEAIRKVKHRIDRRLVTTVGFMYCISLMDRTNLSAANIAGMKDELKLGTLYGGVSRYSVVTLVFFATYIVFQFPSTVVIRYLGPRNHLAGITLLWGAVMIGMGVCYVFRVDFLIDANSGAVCPP